jgi:hypothetical protein
MHASTPACIQQEMTGRDRPGWTVAARDEPVLNHSLGRDIPVVGLIYGGSEKYRTALAGRQGILHHSIARV